MQSQACLLHWWIPSVRYWLETKSLFLQLSHGRLCFSESSVKGTSINLVVRDFFACTGGALNTHVELELELKY